MLPTPRTNIQALCHSVMLLITFFIVIVFILGDDAQRVFPFLKWGAK